MQFIKRYKHQHFNNILIPQKVVVSLGLRAIQRIHSYYYKCMYDRTYMREKNSNNSL